MKVDNKNGIGNPYHDDNTGEFASSDVTVIKEQRDFLNSLDKNVMWIINSNNMPNDYKKDNNIKCSYSTGQNLLKAYNDKNVNEIKLCIGRLANLNDNTKSNLITHMWLEIDGDIFATSEPSNTKRVETDYLIVDKNKDLASQVEDFFEGKITNQDKIIGNRVFDIKNGTTGEYFKVLDPKNKVHFGRITMKEYYKFEKGKDIKIEYMTGNEYLQKCASDIFKNDSIERTIKSMDDPQDVDIYVEDMKKGDMFPTCQLDYVNNSQEGRHRALAFMKAFGENTKMPVMVIQKTKVTDEEIKEYAQRAYDSNNPYWIEYVKAEVENNGEEVANKNEEDPYIIKNDNDEENIYDYEYDDDIDFEKILKELDEEINKE